MPRPVCRVFIRSFDHFVIRSFRFSLCTPTDNGLASFSLLTKRCMADCVSRILGKFSRRSSRPRVVWYMSAKRYHMRYFYPFAANGWSTLYYKWLVFCVHRVVKVAWFQDGGRSCSSLDSGYLAWMNGWYQLIRQLPYNFGQRTGYGTVKGIYLLTGCHLIFEN